MHPSKRNQNDAISQTTSLACQSKPKYCLSTIKAARLSLNPEELSEFSEFCQKIPLKSRFLLFQISVSKTTKSEFFEFSGSCVWDCSRVNQGAKNESEHLRCPSSSILGRIWVFGNHGILWTPTLNPVLARIAAAVALSGFWELS